MIIMCFARNEDSKEVERSVGVVCVGVEGQMCGEQ